MSESRHPTRRPAGLDVGEAIERAGQLARSSDFGIEAERLNRRILKLLPDDTGSMTRLAWCLVMRVRPIEAEKLYERVLRIDPESRIAANKLLWLRDGGTTSVPRRRPRSRTRA